MQKTTSIQAQNTWTAIEISLADWLIGLKAGDRLNFSLMRNEVETDTFDVI